MIEIIAPNQTAVIIKVQGENQVIMPQKEAVIVEVGQQGPAGPEGPVGPVGPVGPPGTGEDHAGLLHLDYDHAGHTGFQKEIPYDPDLKALLV